MLAASRFFMEMMDCGVVPNGVICMTLIDGHCKGGDVGEAFTIVKVMLERQVLPDVHIHGLLI